MNKDARWYYYYGSHEEEFFELGPGDMTVDEAKVEALAQEPEGDITIVRGWPIWPRQSVAVNTGLMLDDYLTNNEEAFCDGELNFVVEPADERELEDMVRATFTCWLQRHGWVLPGRGIDTDWRSEIHIPETPEENA